MQKEFLNDILGQAKGIAVKYGHEFVSKSHVLYILLHQVQIQMLLIRSSVNIDILLGSVTNKISSLEVLKLPKDPEMTDEVAQLDYLATQIAISHGNVGIELYDIFSALLTFKNSEEYVFLQSAGFKVDTYKKDIKTNRQKYNLWVQSNQNAAGNSAAQKSEGSTAEDQVPAWLKNMNDEVKKKTVDPLIGREMEVEKIIHTISKKKKNNAVLVGEPGVGKTAIIEGLAKKIVQKEVPTQMLSAQVYSLDMTAFMAGTGFRGQLEAKMAQTIDFLKKIPGVILFIDEIHMIMNAGATSDSSMSVSNILKPALASGEISFIGATTYKEFTNIFEKDAALSRRFQKIDIEEPSAADTVRILAGLQSSYAKFHDVTYKEDAIQAAVDLSIKYINGKFLPDKAIDVLDEAGTLVKFNPEIYKKTVTPEAIRKVISKIARIPEETMTDSAKDQVKNLSENLKKSIFGQDQAIAKVVSVVEVSKAGLGNPRKPIGSFIFSGPTGVGKTELTNQLKINLSMPLTRIDMSEYKEEHSTSKLIGTVPGYVGFDQEGQLTGAVLRNPASIILLDEIEKAHPKVMDLLLQVLDYGTLTDGKGKKADFRQAIIICTTNLGSEETTKAVIGMTTQAIESQRDPLAILKKALAPEFLNRFDGIVWFNALNVDNIKQVLSKHVNELSLVLAPKSIKFSLTPEAETYLINKGYSSTYGARPMERVFQDEIKNPLAREILYGKLVKGGEVLVSVNDKKEVIFDVKALKVKKVKEKNGIIV